MKPSSESLLYVSPSLVCVVCSLDLIRAMMEVAVGGVGRGEEVLRVVESWTFPGGGKRG